MIAAHGTSAAGVTGTVILVVLAFALYWAPAVVSAVRGHRAAQVFIVNLFLGWTVIGWIVALVMAAGPDA